MPRFVLLAHDHPHPHFDFMLETGTTLRTWRIDQTPSIASPQIATPLPDHRLAYLDYEGPVSGRRGRVQRVDRGEYSVSSETPECLEIDLRGEHHNGRVRLTRSADQWLFEWTANPS